MGEIINDYFLLNVSTRLEIAILIVIMIAILFLVLVLSIIKKMKK